MAANQSRHRTIPGQPSDTAAPLLENFAVEYQYQPLDLSSSSTRLIQFDPAQVANAPISCRLFQVTFGETPKYEALSYMWGDDTFKKNILVNGKSFLVGQNLWDALNYLRKCRDGQHYWIDAICINQADILERNRQLRIMPHIYTRAQTVLVWLGRKYAKYDVDIGRRVSRDNDAYYSNAEIRLDRMGEELHSDGYWNRVWIVQEIGKARRIHVCYGEKEVEWNILIQNLRDCRLKLEQGPFILDTLRRNKYTGGHTLRTLLMDHQKAVCKDPRDKVYGFVGLAANTYAFPMDYRKSPFQVWKDTMLFENKHRWVPDNEVIHFGKVVKRLLGGSAIATVDQVVKDYASWTGPPLSIDNIRDEATIFKLPAYIAGMIVCVGPSPKQMIDDLDAVDEWKARIQQNYPQNLGSANYEDDRLMEGLLSSETDDLNVLCFPSPRIRWKPHAKYESKIYEYQLKSNNLKQQRVEELPIARENKVLLPTSPSRLYQIQGIAGADSPWKLGIVTEQAQTGDLICWIPAAKKAVAVRLDGGWLHTIGTAVIPECLSERDVAKDPVSFKYTEPFELGVDIETAYVLME